ncbi:PilC/PilY family type IV pilus protein [Halomonas sp. PAMB 3264]|uniref:pilus assembly protein n=1 Tax=Halomonas sp. PAMB 3264 TaxID=3075222 RepID=UPI00289F9242|nr:PilC/PilY family type IV pilus protein [Halomonas sp. PAMB 3264]WNL42610.1 PilC/PilY family type IV pilus protein [Halomonas sp. PAMB 3264]
MSQHSGTRLLLTRWLALLMWLATAPAWGGTTYNPPPPTEPTPTQPTPQEPTQPAPTPTTPISGGEGTVDENYVVPADRTGLSNAPLNVVSQVPPNILLILDNSESGQEGLDGRVAIGNALGDRETLAACQLTTFNASQCPAGARSPLSKSSIMKKVGRDLIDRYRGDINLGLMAYQQNPASRTRDDAFNGRTVVWRLTERALAARYSTDPNPGWYNPGFTGAWDASTKRYRARLPNSSYYTFFNVGVPGYSFEETFSTGVPTRDVTEYWYSIQNSTATSDQVVERFRGFAGYNTGRPVVEPNRVWYDDPVIVGYTGFLGRTPIVGTYNLPLVDSLRQRGIPNWGPHIASLALNQLEWRTASSPGLGYLHVPIGGLNANGSINDAHWQSILTKLQPQRHDWNGLGNPMTDPAWPLLATGLTPIEGTMYTVRDYFLNNTSSGTSFSSAQGRQSGITIPNMSNTTARQCLVNANIWLTDGLPSVDRTGRSLGNNVSQALTDAQNAIRRLYSDTASALPNPVRTYVVGFNLPPDINNLPGVPTDPLGELAKAGGTERAYFANDEASLNQVMRQVLGRIISSSQSSTASAVSSDTFDLQGNNLVYSAGYRSGDWSGRLVASAVNERGQRTPRWDAETMLAQQVGSRRLLTSHQPTGQRKAGALLSTSTSGLTQAEVNWFQGSNQTGLRIRQSPLGDIINASPVLLPGRESRPPLLLVAANDGMLHGFNANTGRELFAYLPAELTQGTSPPLRELTRTGYSHRYFMDGTPAAREITLSNGNKRAIAVGTMGAGGRTVFALDVSNPTNMGAQNVLWEFRRPELGSGVSEPTITQLSDGRWVAIFGNGYNSTSYKAALYVVDLQTGALVARLDTGEGSLDTPNGLATPTVTAWPTFNGGARFAYAGDLNGNLWRFPLTQNGTITKLYTGARTQPITSAPAVTLSGGADNRLMVIFGTGSYFRTQDGNDQSVQQLIGIRDQESRTTSVASGQLLVQEISATGTQSGMTVRATTNKPLTTQLGWRMVLPAGERVIASPSFSSGLPRRVRFSTMRPDTTNPCNVRRVGYFLSLVAESGGSGGGTIFDFNRDGEIDTGLLLNGDAIVGLQLGSGERLVGIKNGDGEETLFTGNPDAGDTGVITVELNEAPLGRRSWRQVND